jgi:alpha-amylase
VAIVARATLPRPGHPGTARRRAGIALAASLSLLLGACRPAPSTAPGEPSAPTTQGAAASQPATCRGASIASPGNEPAWADRVFYEVFVRSFQDSDGDGIGDLAGLTSKLDYLNDGDPSTPDDLGITGIWLMPVAEATSYHGYDVTDYTAVERDYGDAKALRTFVAAAHQRGIEVIADFVINHTSSEHPWFEDAVAGGPHHDWYIWSKTDPGWPSVAGGNPWHLASNGEYYYGAFWEGMPDLNLHNAKVTAEIERVAGAWLDDFGLDGFRIDAAKHLIEDDASHQINTPETLGWLADFSRFVHQGHPDALIVDEVFDISTLAGRYVPDSADLTFDFGLASAYISALQRGRAAPITTALGETLDSWLPNRQASFLANHDQDRVMSQLNGDLPSARLAAFMLMAGPGIPFVYYGEELGMHGRKPDERIRTPMQWSAETPAGGFSSAQPWEALADDWQTVNLAAETGDPGSLVSNYRDDIALRQAHPALTSGTTWPVDGGAESVIAWLRTTPDQTLLVVVNVGDQDVTDYGLSLVEGPLCGVISANAVAEVPAGGAAPLPATPAITATGALERYVPLAALPARSGVVIELARQ